MQVMSLDTSPAPAGAESELALRPLLAAVWTFLSEVTSERSPFFPKAKLNFSKFMGISQIKFILLLTRLLIFDLQ